MRSPTGVGRPGWLLVLAGMLAAADPGLRVEASTPWLDPHGYTPVVVTVEATRDLVLDVQIATNGPSARAIIRVPAGRQVRQTILIPPTDLTWLALDRLAWSDDTGASGSATIAARGHTPPRCVLVDPPQAVNLPTLVTALARSVPGARGGDLIARVDAAGLPERWQGYADWLVLVLTPAGEAALDEAQRAAIATWARAGGSVVLSDLAQARAWTGRGVPVDYDPLTGAAGALPVVIGRHDQHGQWTPEAAPVPGTETVPVKTFVLLALAFAVAVGPLNLWWVRRRNARHLFLVTTPLISLATCLVLILAGLLADGISVQRSVVQVHRLDQRNQLLVRWTGASYFAAFSRSALTLDAQAKARVMDPETYSNRHGRESQNLRLHLDWRQGQELGGAVLPARMNRQWSFVETLPERRRLVLERAGAGYRLANGLGAPLRGLVWREGQSRFWTCGEVAAGETVELVSTALDNPPGLTLGDDASLLVAGATLPATIVHRLGRDAGLAYDLLRNQPGSFTATLAATLDPLPGPDGFDVHPPLVLVYGLLDAGAVP